MQLEDLYAGPLTEVELDARLSALPAPRSSTLLYDAAGELGISPTTRVLDVGCRDGAHGRELARRFGCRVVGLDPVLANLQKAGSRAPRESGADRIAVLAGRMEALPIRSASCEFVWCRDVLNHIGDLELGLRECARALVPGGAMLVYNTFATTQLEPREAAFLAESLCLVPANLSPGFAEEAFRRAGFAVLRRDVVASEWREHWEATGERVTSVQLLRIARLRRGWPRLVAELGERPCTVELADCLWGIYQMLGKLEPRIYLLRKAP